MNVATWASNASTQPEINKSSMEVSRIQILLFQWRTFIFLVTSVHYDPTVLESDSY